MIRLKFTITILLFIFTLSSCDNEAQSEKNVEQEEQTISTVDDTYGVPDFILTKPAGDKFQLSTMKGKLVLLDFWASWCKPCRNSHPELVELYKEYKDQKFKDANGFSVVSVSIDEDAQQWRKAIEEDGLVWDTHAIDPNGWHNGVAAKYNVQMIPMNFLLGPDGKIIAQDVHGERLRQLINERLQ